MITEFKIGEVYKLTTVEDLYHFANHDKDRDEYQIEELAGNYKEYQPGTLLTYIRTITEIRKRFTDDKEILKLEVPVFYIDDTLVTSFASAEEMKKSLEEVVDDDS